jgi:hypothetical protein
VHVANRQLQRHRRRCSSALRALRDQLVVERLVEAVILRRHERRGAPAGTSGSYRIAE